MVNLWNALKSVVREAVGRSMVDVSEIAAIGVDGTSSTLVSADWMIPKILWLLENEPGNFEKTVLFMEQVDWIKFKLTGEFALSVNHITHRWFYNCREGGA